MKYCIHCGAELPAEASFCSACGKPQKQTNEFQYAPQSPQVTKPKNPDTLGKVGLAFNIVSIVLIAISALCYVFVCVDLANAIDGYLTGSFYLWTAFLLVPIIWCIPMTVILAKKLKNNKPIGVGFKVCTLIFVSLVSGIVLLCRKEDY